MKGWTEERLAQAEQLWRGGMSAAQISKALDAGITRNAVIGKAYRLGWSGNAKPAGKAAPEPAAAKPRKQTIRKPPRPVERHFAMGFGARFQSPVPLPATPVSEPPKPPVARMVSLMDLKFGDCRFPLGDPRHADFGYCGAKALPRRSYCEWHFRLAYQPIVSRREREAA